MFDGDKTEPAFALAYKTKAKAFNQKGDIASANEDMARFSELSLAVEKLIMIPIDYERSRALCGGLCFRDDTLLRALVMSKLWLQTEAPGRTMGVPVGRTTGMPTAAQGATGYDFGIISRKVASSN